MSYARFSLIPLFAAVLFLACNKAGAPASVPLSDNKGYAASLFRQNCAICHGQDANGKTLEDGKLIPSLRKGEFKFKTDAQIYNQIANGGNGMVPFHDQLTDREIRMLAEFVQNELRRSP